MKKLFALLLAMIMVFSLAATVFAESTGGEGGSGDNIVSGTIEDTRGSITVNNITLEDDRPVATYKIYQMMKLNSFNFTSNSYIYEITDEWEPFLTGTGKGAEYITTNENGHIVWNGDSGPSRVEEFAKLALEFAQNPANGVTPTATTLEQKDAEGQPCYQYRVTGDNQILFEDLELGYYLVDSSVGALCGLSSTNPNAQINSKNGAPTIDKQVQEDLNGQWGKSNSEDIGQMVNFRTTIIVHDGAQNYVLHDIMDPGFIFDVEEADFEVRLFTPTSPVDGTLVDPGNYEVKTNCDNCTFTVEFDNDFLAHLETGNNLVVHYKALLSRDAEIGNGTAQNPANQNITRLAYGDGHFTEDSSTTTNTYAIDLAKTDGQRELLDGSTFRIYADAAKQKPVNVVRLVDSTTNEPITYTLDGKTFNMYRMARTGEDGVDVIVVNGLVRIIGFDNGTYYLDEVEAPDGFNKISEVQSFTIADNNHDAILIGNVVSTNSGIQVVNHTGTMLPETGAMGTSMFIMFGMFVVLGTGILLVTKKRMSMIEE